MTMNDQGRPSSAAPSHSDALPTISGDRGLDHEESFDLRARPRRA